MTSWVEGIVSGLGYAGIAMLMFLENIFPPIPSELIMPMAGFATARGEMSFAWIAVAGTVGSVLGQLPLYYLGRVLGERKIKAWADRYGGWVAVSAEDVERAQRWFDQRGSVTVLLARFVPGIRTWVSVPAGICHMNLLKFLLYSTIGMGLWVIFLAFLGRLLADNYTRVESYIGPVSSFVMVGFFLAAILWVVHRRRGMASRGDGRRRSEAESG